MWEATEQQISIAMALGEQAAIDAAKKMSLNMEIVVLNGQRMFKVGGGSSKLVGIAYAGLSPTLLDLLMNMKVELGIDSASTIEAVSRALAMHLANANAIMQYLKAARDSGT